MLGCKPVDTPMDPNIKIGMEKDSPLVDKGRYQRLVGKLIYLAHTWPAIGFVISVISQFMNTPTEEHMNAISRVLIYLKGIPGKGLLFGKSPIRKIKVYSDADWAGSPTDRCSILPHQNTALLYGETWWHGGPRSNMLLVGVLKQSFERCLMEFVKEYGTRDLLVN